MIKNLNQKEKNLVSGGMTEMRADGSFRITGDSMMNINGLHMYSDHIIAPNGETIFEGTSGSFEYQGNKFAVKPYQSADGNSGIIIRPVRSKKCKRCKKPKKRSIRI